MEATNEKYFTETSAGGCKIILPRSDPSPEVMAMLQAKYSRDPKSVETHLEEILSGGEEAAKKFMSTYYVGYGHRSIGRCGFITLFVENISILAATWVVHNPRFNGQECSTRYLNFFTQGHYVPEGGSESEREKIVELRDVLMKFYSEGLEETIADLEIKFPYGGPPDDRVKKGQWTRTIRAKAFDILRGFLPVSCKTNVAITMSLMDFQDHVLFLHASPLAEAREIGQTMEALLVRAYPSSFRKPKGEEVELYRNLLGGLRRLPLDRPREIQVDLNVTTGWLYEEMCLQVERSRGTKITQFPREYEQAATVKVSGLLDFGSWRDIHRHTSADHALVHFGPFKFEDWYIESLPERIRGRALDLIEKCKSMLSDIDSDLLQYSTPMGFKVVSEWTTGIRSLLYIVNLRSQDTVHPTLRKFILEVADHEALEDIKFSLPEEAKEFNLRRGDQTIIEKDKVDLPTQTRR